MKNEMTLEIFWSELPTGKENAVDYPTLCSMWDMTERAVRNILHELSSYDNGDDYVLIRSGKTKGFYKTDDKAEITAYRKECLNKGRSVFAPVRKCNRILRTDTKQIEMFNNLRVVRVGLGMSQPDVCRQMKEIDKHFDTPLLSKMENGVCLPTFTQLAKLAEIYGVEPTELIRADLPAFDVFEAI